MREGKAEGFIKAPAPTGFVFTPTVHYSVFTYGMNTFFSKIYFFF